MEFVWRPGKHPHLEDHSRAKLAVLGSYIRAYFDVMGMHMGREQFKLVLVDGFAGGGEFTTQDSSTAEGSPIVMLQEVEAAKTRLSKGREKQLHFDCRYHFVEKDSHHMKHLKDALKRRGYSTRPHNIFLHSCPFDVAAPKIIRDIKAHQPKVGRSIFLLDQTGYSGVAMRTVREIFANLPGAEVIMTFAVVSLINFLKDEPGIIKSVAPIELRDSQIKQIIENKKKGRALIQRVLREHILAKTGAAFDTPFFLNPKKSRRTLWFLHLSRHPKARDVMIKCHWNCIIVSAITFLSITAPVLAGKCWDGMDCTVVMILRFSISMKCNASSLSKNYSVTSLRNYML